MFAVCAHWPGTSWSECFFREIDKGTRPLCCHCPRSPRPHSEWARIGLERGELATSSAISDHHTVRKVDSAGAAFMLLYIYPSLVYPGDRLCGSLPSASPAPRGLLSRDTDPLSPLKAQAAICFQVETSSNQFWTLLCDSSGCGAPPWSP